jgi:gas vesicle protein
MDNDKIIGFAIAFMGGVAVGVLAALLLAPASGAETRSQILVKANASGQQIKAGYAQSRQWVTDQAGRLNKTTPAESDLGM